MPETYAARINGNSNADLVIVIPEGEDAATYCAALGLSGTWRACPSLPGKGDRYHGRAYYPQWKQIHGAGLGFEGAESGYPVGFEVWHDGAVRVSRVANNVNEPLDGVSTTWSRKDGVPVVPAGWQYRIGEELTEGGKWYRVKTATPFAPSAAPSLYDEVDGPGGDVVTPAISPWVQPTGGHDAYALGAIVTHNGATWENTGSPANVWEPGVFGWTQV